MQVPWRERDVYIQGNFEDTKSYDGTHLFFTLGFDKYYIHT